MKSFLLKLLPLALAVAACSGNQSSESKSGVPAEKQAVLVEVQTVGFANVPQVSSYSSSIQAYATNNIMPQQGGRIRKINVEVGDYVGKGQILAEMDRLQLDQLALQVQNDDIEYARLKTLYEEGGVSQSDFETAELGYKLRKSNYQNLEENTILRSPLTGYVTARNFDVGDMCAMTAPLFTIQQVTPVKLLVGISESEYTLVKKGDKVDITVDALPGRSFEGKVNRLYPTIDPVTHTFSAEVLVQNSDRVLRPGMYAKVSVTFGDNERIVIPDMAIVKQSGTGQKFVFVVNEDHTVTLTPVTLGRHMESEYEVLEGLSEGVTIVTKGHATLRSGDKVEVKA
ncbi:MAG: efflux RND transporter periplasmic adaptor subunit [Bacteroidota bacterium]|nr:efflux RND transporter periplasmic adaptor subunit [Bacteroidota bacterium]